MSLPNETLEFAHRMFDAARNGDSEVLVSAIDAGLPCNLTNDKGNTLLMLAAYAGHTGLVRDLLKRGADPNRVNDMGQSIIAGAVFKGHDDIVCALVESGADPRLGRPNAVEAAHMFKKAHLMNVLGAQDNDVGPEVPTSLRPPT
ncbi:ankyrin [Fistulina hepatica ATCC 64428]|uniref:Ankyrin n=1 Tax=Fistulina hepatica ATCC 64428 TaxID=1128425 RepID=A0A0D7AJX1_9AGAR|nr:ankyrin [Fistulina hepatica ATCC 64428]